MMERVEKSLPGWARALDVLGVGLILIALSVIATGGFREWTPFGRVSVTSWIRPVVIGILALFARHAVWRSPSIVARGRAAFFRWRTSAEARALLPIFFSTRIGVLAIGFLGLALFGYAANMPPWRVYPNDLLNLPARWDAGWYLSVALEGYTWDPRIANRQQNIAFFPAYPMLMRYGSLFFARQTLWVGVLIALVAFVAAMKYLYWLSRLWVDHDRAVTVVALVAAYPFALFFSAPYTESLFLLTTVAACFHFERNELWKAGLWGLVAGLTRPNGCLLSVALAFMAIRPWYGPTREVPVVARRLAAAAMPGVGMLLYSAYIYALTGNPLQWAAQNAAWGRVYKGLDLLVSSHINYVQHNGFYDYATTRSVDLIYIIAVVFALVAVVPVYRRWGLPYAVMILVNVLPPLFMGGLLSMGRVTSVIFPLFLWLGAAVPERHRSSWLIGFGMMQALCAVAFFTWRPLY